MLGSKPLAIALAGMLSLQAFAAPIVEPTTELVVREKTSDLTSADLDFDMCLWQSGMLFVGWSVLMKQYDGKSTEDMLKDVEKALKANSACNTFTMVKQIKGGVGKDHTTMAMQFNTDDFCTASQVSHILQKVSGRSDLKCSDSPEIPGGDPDTSDVIQETIAADGGEEEIEKRANKGTATAAAPASTGSSNTAHPQGLAQLTEASVQNGIQVPSVKDMATRLHMPNPESATRAEVIEKLQDPNALDN